MVHKLIWMKTDWQVHAVEEFIKKWHEKRVKWYNIEFSVNIKSIYWSLLDWISLFQWCREHLYMFVWVHIHQHLFLTFPVCFLSVSVCQWVDQRKLNIYLPFYWCIFFIHFYVSVSIVLISYIAISVRLSPCIMAECLEWP